MYMLLSNHIFCTPFEKIKIKGCLCLSDSTRHVSSVGVDRGLLHKNSPLHLFLLYYEKLNYQIADWIGVQSEMNLTILSDRFHLRNIRSNELVHYRPLKKMKLMILGSV